MKLKTRTKVIAAFAFAAFMIVAGWALWAFLSPKEASEATTSQPTKKFELVAKPANLLVVDEGVVFKAFTFNGTMPGPLLVVEEGDTVEITVRNEDTITHGLSIHAANTQTSLFVGNIGAKQTKTLTFKADFPGVFMYHCAPGGHGIMTHTLGGMFGMIVVEPKKKYKLEEQLGKAPDLKIYVIQHEVYSNGRDFFDGKPLYVMFNGYNFRYVTEPIPARPGDYIRMIGNSFWPKVVEVPVGAEVTWVNEEVFDLLDGERTGQHNAVAIKGPETFASPLLSHADKFTFKFTKPGEYEYICAVHPYMKAKVRVYEQPSL